MYRVYLISMLYRLFQKNAHALQAWASQLVSISQACNFDLGTQADGASVAFLTQNAAAPVFWTVE
jgi:hypothetical protein